MWKWLEEKHPIIHELIWWGIAGLALATIIKDFIR